MYIFQQTRRCLSLSLGNRQLLECDEVWRQLISDYMQKKAVVRVDTFIHGMKRV